MSEAGNDFFDKFSCANSAPIEHIREFFVTRDYVVPGWSKEVPVGTGFAPGTINVPD
jgi:hypothetical protein